MTVEILWRDGFDHYNSATDLATVYASVSAFSSFGAGRTDGESIVLVSGFADTLEFQGLASLSDITLAVATYNEAGTNTNAQTYVIYDSISGATMATLNLNTPNLAIVTLNNGSSYSGAIPIIPMLNWTHIQFRLIIGSAGSFELRLNGGSVAAFTKTGINTLGNSGAVTTANGVQFPIGGGGYYGRNQLDDLIIATGGFPGDCRIQTDFPISDYSVAFTPLSGSSNFAMVDEVAMDSNTTYNYTSTAGAIDYFGFTPLNLPDGSTVLDVSLVSAVAKSDAGTRAFQHTLTSGGTQALGTPFGPSTSYEYQVDAFETDPSTGAAWTEAGINAAYYGYLCEA